MYNSRDVQRHIVCRNSDRLTSRCYSCNVASKKEAINIVESFISSISGV